MQGLLPLTNFVSCMSNEYFLEKYRAVGDMMADRVVDVIQSASPAFWKEESWKDFVFNRHQVNVGWDHALKDFLEATSQLPPWADPKAMTRAGRFYKANESAILLCLGLYSLPYCYAAADGAKVLYYSSRMREGIGKRLSETASFVSEVSRPNAFSADGKAFRSIQKVRLMHALSRHYVSQQPFWSSSWGKPVNQEDMAGTNLAFSLIVLRGLRKLGLDVQKQAAQDFLHLWRVIGFLMGVNSELLPIDAREAIQLEKQIIKRHFRKSVEGIELTKSLSGFMNEQLRQGKFELPAEAVMTFLLGDQISSMLDLKRPKDNFVSDAIIAVLKLQNIFGVNFLLEKSQIQAN